MTDAMMHAMLAIAGIAFAISLYSGRAVWAFGLTGDDARRRAALCMFGARVSTYVLAAVLGFGLVSLRHTPDPEGFLPLVLPGLALVSGAGLVETRALLAKATEQPWSVAACAETDIVAEVVADTPIWLSTWNEERLPALLLKVPASSVLAHWALVAAAWGVGGLIALSGAGLL